MIDAENSLFGEIADFINRNFLRNFYFILYDAIYFICKLSELGRKGVSVGE